MNNKKIINVALPIKINSLYSYYIPDDMNIKDVIGRRVLVDFNGRKIRGFALSEGEDSNKFKIKNILKIIDNRIIFNSDMVELAKWISEYYFAGIGEVLSLMIPKGIKPISFKDIINFIPQVKELNFDQKNIYENIKRDINTGEKRFYLYGVTGSGKTEIYIKLIEDILKENKTVIFLVPEIAISYQTLKRLQDRFGDICAVLHSNLKTSVRLREYLRLLDEKAKIVIGPRSALFAPLKNIGLIIIDEENESSYKSEESPRFHARTVSQYISKKNSSILLLGSATPSIESYYYAKNGFFKFYSLKERYGTAVLPELEIIDSSQFATKKNLTLPLIQEINKRLQQKEQVILLQNRRGFANFIKCQSCNQIIICPRCSISLTYHKIKQKLICHHCGYSIVMPENCPNCKDEKLIKIGAGTQRIEDEIIETFKFARVQRMDQDSLKSEANYLDVIHKMENGQIDILIGTQMIAKGLHFPNIKFVGIINADIILNIPDYKSSERAFSLITQVAGRAGREGTKGFVLIQTMNPDHYSIVAAKENDYEKFYDKEIEFRKLLGLPPFNRLLRLVIRGSEEKAVIENIKILKLKLKQFQQKDIEILGPAPCIFTKINNNYRHQILLKSRKIELLQDVVRKAIIDFNVKSKNYLEIDVDPIGLF